MLRNDLRQCTLYHLDRTALQLLQRRTWPVACFPRNSSSPISGSDHQSDELVDLRQTDVPHESLGGPRHTHLLENRSSGRNPCQMRPRHLTSKCRASPSSSRSWNFLGGSQCKDHIDGILPQAACLPCAPPSASLSPRTETAWRANEDVFCHSCVEARDSDAVDAQRALSPTASLDINMPCHFQ